MKKIHGITNICVFTQQIIKQFQQISSMSIYIAEFGQYETCIKYNNIAFMDLYTLKFKPQMHKKFMKIFNNMSKNEFDSLKQFKKILLKLIIVSGT